MRYPWFVLHNWAPFHIDALGLVTFLGSDEVNLYIGRLVPSLWFEHMPLLGAFVVAGDRFKEKKPSFNIYNISSGINTSDLSCWFTRWMLAQDFEVSRSVVYWEIIEKPKNWWLYHVTAGSISFCFMTFLIIMTILSKDWYGFANAIAMVFSIVIRAYILQSNRNAVTNAVHNAKPLPRTGKDAMKERDENSRGRPPVGSKPDHTSRADVKHWTTQFSKTLIIMSDSKAVTTFIPERLIIPVFVKNPKPHREWLYELFRWIGWAAFAVHIISIGLAQLAAQMYTVALLVIPTILICWKVGCDDSRPHRGLRRSSGSKKEPYECWIGSKLKATIFEWPDDVEFGKTETDGNVVWQFQLPPDGEERSTRRQDLYAWLNLTEEEEDSMEKWDLLPHRRGDDDTWRRDFNAKRDLIRQSRMDMQAVKNDITRKIEQNRSRIRLHGGQQDPNDNLERAERGTVQHSDALPSTRAQEPKTRLSPGDATSSSTPTPSEQRDHS